MRKLSFFLVLVVFLVPSAADITAVSVAPAVKTQPVLHDADDPAIWVDRRNPAQSLILGTDKGKEGIPGSLYVFNLDGTIRQRIGGLNKPNNVDVEYGFKLGSETIDIAVVTEAHAKRLRIYKISEDGYLSDISGKNTEVFKGEPSDQRTPMGVALYKRQPDGSIFAIVSRGFGPTDGYLGQYLLRADASGKVSLKEVRKFGRFSGKDTIEAIAIDDKLGYVYYADESECIRKYYADPNHQTAGKELAHFGVSEYSADREGIAIYSVSESTGYVICTDQIKNSRYLTYPREGKPGNPHDHGKAIKVIQGGANATDGIETVSEPMGSRFPNGILVVMNSAGRNFYIYDWRDVARTGKPVLGLASPLLGSLSARTE